MDNFLAKIQLWLFKIGDAFHTDGLNFFDKLGNKMQDFRSKYTIKR